jgi:formylglycine-generating enzyme required for sulfatase activity
MEPIRTTPTGTTTACATASRSRTASIRSRRVNQSQDPDLDGLKNLDEQLAGTNPNDSDSDDDGFGDKQEVDSDSDPVDPGITPVLVFLRPVTNANNPADVTGFGSVPYDYSIGTHEVTVREYVSFLNSVAAADPLGLFNDSGDPRYGVARSGSPGSYRYTAVAGRADTPINFVSLYDAMRFVNWIRNGKPAGASAVAATEGGVYPISANGIATNTIERFILAIGFVAVLPSESEWYKAAYGPSGYTPYPTGASGPPLPTVCSPPDFLRNIANCGGVVGEPTPVGSYPEASSRNGTLDQGGNVWEWTEDISGALRRIRGGGYDSPASDLAKESSGQAIDPLTERADLGFRIAVVPAPPLPE